MLKKITLKGFKSIQSLELELRRINILIGANGAGKSNFISFFKLLRWMIQNDNKLQFHIAQSGGANFFLFNGANVTREIEAELNFITKKGQNDYTFRLFYAAPDTLIFAEEKYRFSDDNYPSKANWISLDSGHKETNLFNRRNQGDLTARTIINLIQKESPVYQFHNTSETANLRQRWSIEDNKYLREDGANLAPILLRLKENEPQYYQRIVETIRLIAPFFDDFTLEPIKYNVILQWREKYSDLTFSAHQASDGTLRTIALITLLLQPQEYLPDIIILDEPELGLPKILGLKPRPLGRL